jgi:hypothetical protein
LLESEDLIMSPRLKILPGDLYVRNKSLILVLSLGLKRSDFKFAFTNFLTNKLNAWSLEKIYFTEIEADNLWKRSEL